MSVLMASTVSFHSDPFIARIHVNFLFVVAWKLARKFDFLEKSGLQNCFAR